MLKKHFEHLIKIYTVKSSEAIPSNSNVEWRRRATTLPSFQHPTAF